MKYTTYQQPRFKNKLAGVYGIRYRATNKSIDADNGYLLPAGGIMTTFFDVPFSWSAYNDGFYEFMVAAYSIGDNFYYAYQIRANDISTGGNTVWNFVITQLV